MLDLDLDKGSGTKSLMVTGMEGHMYTEDSAGLFRLRGHTGSSGLVRSMLCTFYMDVKIIYPYAFQTY